MRGDNINTPFFRNKSSVVSFNYLFLTLCKVVMSSYDVKSPLIPSFDKLRTCFFKGGRKI